MKIQIPGYETRFGNRVFVADEQRMVEGTLVKDVLLLRRYQVPSEDDVAAYLVSKAQQMRPFRTLNPGLNWNIFAHRSDLEKTLIYLPLVIFEKLIEEDPTTIRYIKAYTPVPPLEPEVTMEGISVVRGYIHNSTFSINNVLGNISGERWFYHVLGMNGAERLDSCQREAYFFLRLKNNCLPPQAILNDLIAKRELDLEVCHLFENTDRGTFTNTINLVYQGITSPKQVKAIPDVSAAFMDEMASLPLEKLAEHPELAEVAPKRTLLH